MLGLGTPPRLCLSFTRCSRPWWLLHITSPLSVSLPVRGGHRPSQALLGDSIYRPEILAREEIYIFKRCS